MKPNAAQIAWHFSFFLENGEGTAVSEDVAEELLLAIIEWAEARQLQIGGGFSPPRD